VEECFCVLKHQKCAQLRAHLRKKEWVLGVVILLGLCDCSDGFPGMFCGSCGGECHSAANFCHRCGQQLDRVRSRIRRQGKPVKEVFPSGISLRSIDYMHK